MHDMAFPLHEANLPIAAFLKQPAEWKNSVLGALCFSADAVESQMLAPIEDELEQQALLRCLEKLRQKAEKQYQAIWRRFYSAQSDEQIIQALESGQVNTVRKWRQRGLESLKDCMKQELASV